MKEEFLQANLRTMGNESCGEITSSLSITKNTVDSTYDAQIYLVYGYCRSIEFLLKSIHFRNNAFCIIPVNIIDICVYYYGTMDYFFAEWCHNASDNMNVFSNGQ